jgi:hypothetical protein
MSEFCECSEWRNLVESYDFIQWEPSYGWIMKWIELTEEKGYSQVHRYGIPIEFCPKCGKKLKNN